MPPESFADISTQQRTHRSPEVHAHIEDGETAIATMTARGIQRSDDRRNIRLEESVADNQQCQCDIKSHLTLDAHDHVTGGHQQSSDDDGNSLAQQTIGQHSSDERRHVNQSRIRAIHCVRAGVVVAEKPLHHVEDQQGSHAVVRESLPHFGKEQVEQTCGMTKHRGCIRTGLAGCRY